MKVFNSIPLLKKSISLAVIVVYVSGCAAMINGTSQQVNVRSNFDDAKLYVNGDFFGTGSGVTMFRKKKDYVLTARRDGCEETSVTPTKSWDVTTLLGILIDYGIVTMLLIDGALTGAWKQFDQTSFVIDPICPD